MKKDYKDIEKILYDSAKSTSDSVNYKNTVYTSKVRLKDKKERDTTVARSVLQVAGVFLVAAVIGGVAFATTYFKDFAPGSHGTDTDTAAVTGSVTELQEKQFFLTGYDDTFEGMHEIKFYSSELEDTKDVLPVLKTYEKAKKLQTKASKDFPFNVYTYVASDDRYGTYSSKKTWLCLTDESGNLTANMLLTNGLVSADLIYAEKSPAGGPVAVISYAFDSGVEVKHSVCLYDSKTDKTELLYNFGRGGASYEPNDIFYDVFTLRANTTENKIELIRSVRRSGSIAEHIKNINKLTEGVEAGEEYFEITDAYFKEFFEKDSGLNDRVYGKKVLIKTDSGYGFVDFDVENALPSGTEKVLYRAPELTVARKFVSVKSNGETYYPDAMGHRTGMCDDGSLQELTYNLTVKDCAVKYGEDFDIRNNVYGKEYRIIKIRVYGRAQTTVRTELSLESDAIMCFNTVSELKEFLKTAKNDNYTVMISVSWDDGIVENPGDATYRFSYFLNVNKYQ